MMAMQHGQRAAYYLRHFLEGNRDPLPYRTPYRTRRVPVAQDLMWEKFPIQDPVFCGLGERPVEFPEIELTYDTNSARAEAARCYRCDAETGSADYSVQHREDIFSMARTDPQDAPKLKAMLDRRLRLRENPFPQERPACLDDLVSCPRTCRGSSSTPTARPARSAGGWASASISTFPSSSRASTRRARS